MEVTASEFKKKKNLDSSSSSKIHGQSLKGGVISEGY